MLSRSSQRVCRARNSVSHLVPSIPTIATAHSLSGSGTAAPARCVATRVNASPSNTQGGLSEEQLNAHKTRRTMKAAAFIKKDKIALVEKPIPKPKGGEALVRITTTTICGTDVHILKAEYPVAAGLTVGHEPVGVIVELGDGLQDHYKVGQRVIVGAITPCGQCYLCLSGIHSQCGSKAMGGWRFGNTIDGAQAEYLLVPDARANLSPVPQGLTDEHVLMCPDIMSTGFSGAESGNVKIGDTVAVFAQGPIGLCATMGARLRGASTIIGVDALDARLTVARRFGATHTINVAKQDVLKTVAEITNGQGVDVAIEALGTQATFENALRVLRPGGTLSSLGVYSGKLQLPLEAFSAGLGDHKIITTLCPGGKERMRRLMRIVEGGATQGNSHIPDVSSLVTHRFKLDQIESAYDLFANQRDGVLKVAITP